jgi:hypothetical protein
MNSLEQQITTLAKAAVKALYDVDAADAQIQLQKTRPEFEGNITLVVFPFVKAARKAPAQVAAEIGEWMCKPLPGGVLRTATGSPIEQSSSPAQGEERRKSSAVVLWMAMESFCLSTFCFRLRAKLCSAMRHSSAFCST